MIPRHGARSPVPGAACSMSQESYGTVQQVSHQPTTAPKTLFNQVRDDEGVEGACISSRPPLSPSPYNAAVPKGPAFSFLNY